MASDKNNEPLGKAPEIQVGASDAVLLAVSFFGFLFLATTIYSIILTRVKSAQEIKEEDEKESDYEERLARADVSKLSRAERRARARHIMKQQRRVAPAPGVPNENGDVPEPNLMIADDSHGGQLTRKERQRAAKATEREERRLFEEDRRKQQEKAQEKAKQLKKEHERILSEKAEEERKQRQIALQEEEHMSYLNWKTFISSPDKSVTSITVKTWIQELEQTRLAKLQILADRFGVSKQDVVDRINELLATCRVAGILEENRFVYIAPEELLDLASFVQNRDSTTLRDLATEADELINR